MLQVCLGHLQVQPSSDLQPITHHLDLIAVPAFLPTYLPSHHRPSTSTAFASRSLVPISYTRPSIATATAVDVRANRTALDQADSSNAKPVAPLPQ